MAARAHAFTAPRSNSAKRLTIRLFNLATVDRPAVIRIFWAGLVGATMPGFSRFRESRQDGFERRPGLANPGDSLRFKSLVLKVIFSNRRDAPPHVLASQRSI